MVWGRSKKKVWRELDADRVDVGLSTGKGEGVVSPPKSVVVKGKGKSFRSYDKLVSMSSDLGDDIKPPVPPVDMVRERVIPSGSVPPPPPSGRAENLVSGEIEYFKRFYGNVFGMDSLVPSSGEVLRLNLLFSIYSELRGVNDRLDVLINQDDDDVDVEG